MRMENTALEAISIPTSDDNKTILPGKIEAIAKNSEIRNQLLASLISICDLFVMRIVINNEINVITIRILCNLKFSTTTSLFDKKE